MVIINHRKNYEAPRPGDMNKFISLARLSLDAGGADQVGFDETVEPYANVKAQVLSGNASYTPNGFAADEDITYTFIIRKDRGINIADNDVVIYKDRYYKIVDWLELDSRRRYLILNTIDAGGYTLRDSTVDSPSTIKDDNETAGEPDDSPFW